MKTSARGVTDIAYSEGEVLEAYQDRLTDPHGKYRDVPTIGFGHTSAAGPPLVTMGMKITHEQALKILAADLVRTEVRVSAALGPLPNIAQNVFDGAVSFDLNTGAINRASWVILWLHGQAKQAEAHFMEWRFPPEIVGRRKREADLIFRGVYHSSLS